MCYYDHATRLALRLDQWDMGGANGTGEFGIENRKYLIPISAKPSTQSRLRVRIKAWLRTLKASRAAQ